MAELIEKFKSVRNETIAIVSQMTDADLIAKAGMHFTAMANWVGLYVGHTNMLTCTWRTSARRLTSGNGPRRKTYG